MGQHLDCPCQFQIPAKRAKEALEVSLAPDFDLILVKAKDTEMIMFPWVGAARSIRVIIGHFTNKIRNQRQP